ncbi:MAG: hybrid sensor histidine kinase/response regulator [Planctomycetes bacterium]|nr:hybrid sensor histidine kinase/response regulator [Planctomycetota bacterium]
MSIDPGDARQLLALTAAALWTADADLRFTAPQPAWERFTGQPWGEHAGRGWLRAFRPADRAAVEGACGDAAATGRLEASGRLWHAASASYRDVLVRAVRTAEGPGYLGAVTGDAAADCPVCGRLDEVEAAASSVRGAPDLLAAACRAAQEALRLCEAEAAAVSSAGVHLGSAVAGDPALAALAQVPAGAEPCVSARLERAVADLAVVVARREGRFDAREDGRVLERLVRAADDARRLLAALDAARRKDEFLAVLGHELRNPLATILTALELLRLRGAGGEREQRIIHDHVRHIVRLADDLLDVSRIARGTLRLSVEADVDVPAVLARAVEHALPLLEQRRHRLAVDVAPGLRAQADPVRLAQVVGNLLTNAARYTDAGGSVRLSAGREDAALVIRVADDGPGISAEQQARIFAPFVQLEGPGRVGQGLGIGLALVRSLVELHGGSVQVESVPGDGSTFVVRLPQEVGAAARAASGRHARPGAPRVKDVLVVEDSHDAADTLAEALTGLGYTARVAYDGAGALRAFALRPAQVVLLDLGLPDLDGLEVAQRLRALPGGAAARLIALTGHGQEEDRRQSEAAGVDDHVLKPVDLDRLVERIERA